MMGKISFSILVLILFMFSPLISQDTGFKYPVQAQRVLKVSANGHSIEKDGKPFFWMGDTGWLLPGQSPEDVDLYFKNRVHNQFNVIQMMITRRMFNDLDFQPNYRNDLPFESLSPLKINESYFVHIDSIVKKAERNNLILAMVPTWGWNLDQMFAKDDPGQAYEFGYLLGKRYGSYKNIVWVVCGEYHLIAWDTEKKKPDGNPDISELNLIDSLARGIKNGSKEMNLMTIHPDSYKSSSDHFHNADWLDFNMVQSFSIRGDTEFDIIDDYLRKPAKPTILSEPGYEGGFSGNKSFEVRYEGYHSVLEGGFGFTFGCEGIWNFEDNWKDLLNSEGALEMKYLRKLFESRPMTSRVPAPGLIAGHPGDWVKKTKLAAAIDSSGAYAFIYFPNDTIVAEIRVSEISGEKANAWWYNVRDGLTYDANGKETKQFFSQFPCNLSQTAIFDPPGNEGYGKDWVLILDNSDKEFIKPARQ